jgi:hypothetical protein
MRQRESRTAGESRYPDRVQRRVRSGWIRFCRESEPSRGQRHGLHSVRKISGWEIGRSAVAFAICGAPDMNF